MYRIYKNILHSFQGDFKILAKGDIYFKRILWLISWSLQDDQGGICHTVLSGGANWGANSPLGVTV